MNMLMDSTNTLNFWRLEETTNPSMKKYEGRIFVISKKPNKVRFLEWNLFNGFTGFEITTTASNWDEKDDDDFMVETRNSIYLFKKHAMFTRC